MTDDLDDTDIKKALVKNQKCFSKLTQMEVDVLANLLEQVSFIKGDVIVSQGDPVDSVYFIVNGKADVRLVSIQEGKQVFKSLAKLGERESVGLSETGFYSLSGIRTATVVADTDMTVYRLSVAAFNGFALAYPHVNEVMSRNPHMTAGL